MARASTLTWLSLDRYAHIMQLHPAFFNGVYSTVFPLGTGGCSEIWMQYAWQEGGKVSREDIAQAIQDAERRISAYLGYNLLPDWVADERQRTTRPGRPDLYNLDSRNPRGMYKSIITKRAHFISGGIRAKTLIDDAVVGTASDEDGDGYAETLTFTVTTTIDPQEVHVYHTGEAGADEWEIRPVTIVDNGATLTITLKIWQLVDPALWEAMNAAAIDGDVATNFQQCVVALNPVHCVDVYRVHNDPQTQATLVWEEPSCSTCGGTGCQACEHGTQTACLATRDHRLGIVTYHPAVWDAAASAFDADDLAECREPDRLRLYYYSGFRSEKVTYPELQMDPELERSVAYFATSLLDRPLCTCENASRFADHWREDLALVAAGKSFQNSAGLLECPFGTMRGALYAWRVVNQDGRRVER